MPVGRVRRELEHETVSIPPKDFLPIYEPSLISIRRHTYDTDNTCRMVFDALAKDIKPTEHTPSGVELILGISTNGTSYVFLSEYQTCLVMAHSGGQLLLGGRFKSPSDFESLSPIQFPSVNDLVLKIKKYKPKNKKGERFDNSAANKPYSRATVRSWRSEFELNRCASLVLLHMEVSLPLIR